MATIRSTIQLNDQISGVLRNISTTLNATINSFEGLQRASTNGVNTNNIEAARRAMGNLNNSINQLSPGLQGAENSQQRLNRSIDEGAGNLDGFLGTLLGVVGAYASLQGLQQVLQLSDLDSNTTARLNLVNDGNQTGEQLEANIRAAADRSLTYYNDFADTVGQIGLRAPEAFGSNAETILFAENLNKAFTIAGTNVQEVNSATLQLTQALGSGVLRGEEFNAVFEAAPNIIQLIAKSLNEPISNIRQLAEDGELSADVVKRALLGATDAINEQFNQIPLTFERATNLIRTQAFTAFRPVFQVLQQTLNNESVIGFVRGLQPAFTLIANLAANALQIIVNIGSFIAQNFAFIGPILFIVAGSIGVLTTAFIAIRSATLLAAAAQAIWNSALLANPIVLFLLAIVAVIAAIGVLIAGINEFAGTSISAVGVVTAIFYTLFAFLYNNVVTTINLFITFAEFLYNVFRNPIYSIQRLFVNLLNVVLDVADSIIGSYDNVATSIANAFVSGVNIAIRAINSLTSALNNIPGIEIGQIGEIGRVGSVASNLRSVRNGVNNLIGEEPENYRSLNRLSLKGLPDAAVNGYNVGSGITSSFGQGNSATQTIEDLLKDISDSTGEGADEGKKTSKNTKKAADKAGILTDDLKYLRDLSERDAINRYTTASVKVDVNNNNNINSALDIDGIVDRFGERIEEVAESLAGGALPGV